MAVELLADVDVALVDVTTVDVTTVDVTTVDVTTVAVAMVAVAMVDVTTVGLDREGLLERTATLEAFRRGQESGVRALYRRYGRLVYAVAYRVLGRRDLAEEAAQETFVKAWQTADRMAVDRDPAPWLATIAKRTAIDIHRREASRPAGPLGDLLDHDRALVTPPPDMERLDAVWQVRRAIDDLPGHEAVVVRLQHLDGMTHGQISERLGIPIGTVKSRSRRAHRHLAALLGHLRTAPDTTTDDRS